jgi:hypothetical protein
MQGCRVRGLMVLLLVVAGCRRQTETQSSAPVGATTPFNVQINLDKRDVEAHTRGLPQGSIVQWNSRNQFYVEFTAANPCRNSAPDQNHPKVYPSSSLMVGLPPTTVWVASCTIANPPNGTPYPYKISAGSPDRNGLPPAPPPPPPGAVQPTQDTGGHCEGCFLDQLDQ